MNSDNEQQVAALFNKVNELNAKLVYYTNMINEMDEKIYHLQMWNNAQQEYINSHARKFNRIYKTIYQICGKVFDHNTEMDYIINYMNYMIHNNHCCTHYLNYDDNRSEIGEGDSEGDSIDNDSDNEQ